MCNVTESRGRAHKNFRAQTVLWEFTKIEVDKACKVQPSKRQLLLDLEVTETGLCSNRLRESVYIY